MSTWNHRLCKKTSAPTEWAPTGEVYYGIYEVFYNDNGDILYTTEDSVKPFGETIEEIKTDLERMLKAVSEPIIDLDTIVYAKEEDDGINWDEVEDDNFEDKYDTQLKIKFGDDYRDT